MHGAEPEHDVGAGALAEADHDLDPERVQHVHEVLAHLLHRGEAVDVLGAVLLALEVDVDEDGLLLDLGHGRVVGEPLPRVVVLADVVDGEEDASRVPGILVLSLSKITLDPDIESAAPLRRDDVVVDGVPRSGGLILVVSGHLDFSVRALLNLENNKLEFGFFVFNSVSALCFCFDFGSAAGRVPALLFLLLSERDNGQFLDFGFSNKNRVSRFLELSSNKTGNLIDHTIRFVPEHGKFMMVRSHSLL